MGINSSSVPVNQIVSYFQAMQQDIASRQPDFESINLKAKQLEMGESKMAAYTTQLNTRYQTLKTSIKVPTCTFNETN